MNEAHPKKSLGQHWLYDEEALSVMCKAADVGSGDVILEIGPGLGTLTRVLVEKAKTVVAVELDEVLAAGLMRHVPAANLKIVQQDILRFDFSSLPAGYKVVANIPYYLTSNLIKALSETSNPPAVAVLLVQKEVAERAAAQPGDMSVLAVLAQFYWQVRLGPTVPAALFTPPPKVDSQILILHHRAGSLYPVQTRQFFKLVKAGFGQRRKTLENALSGGLGITKQQAGHLLAAGGIAPNARAQTLTLEEWYKLHQAYVYKVVDK